MAAPAAVLSILIRANTGQAVSGLAKVNTQLEGTAGKSGKASKALAMVGKVGAVGAAVGLGYAVKKAADFESQMSSLGAVTKSSSRQMGQFKKQALDAGAATKFSALEAAKAQTELAKGGLTVSQIMRGGLKSALALAAAGEMELADAAETTANAMKLFGLRGKDSMKVADALSQAAISTTADVKDFAMALKMGGSVARMAGLSFNDTVVVLEALAEAGIKNSDAGTSMKAFFLNITRDAPKAKEAMKELGVNIFDASGKLKTLPAISSNLRKAFGSLTKEQFLNKAGTIAGSDAVRTLYALYAAGPDKLKVLQRDTAKYGTGLDVAAKKQDNLKGKLETLKGSIETLAIVVGTGLIPPLSDAAVAATNFVNGLLKSGQSGNQFKSMVASLGRTLDISSADLRAMGQAATNVFNGIRAVVRASLPGVIQMVRGWGQVLAGVIKVITGILTLDFRRMWSGIKQIFRGGWNAVIGQTRSALAQFGQLLQGFGRLIGSAFTSAWRKAGKVFGDVMAGVLRGFAKVFDAASHLPIIGSKFKGLGDKVRRTANEVDNLGEDIDRVGKKRVTARVLLDIVSRDLATGDVKPLKPLGSLGDGGGKDYGTGVKGAVVDSAQAWAKRNKKGIEKSIGLGAGVGALGGGSKSRVDGFNSIAGRFGNIVTSGFRPGDRGWHGKNRARDYAGGNMLGFARHMASKYGKNLLELIHTPLGFGIKNGRRVPPYAAADHFDHVHVAMRKGGLVPGSGSGDRVPALLEAGEGIINRRATAAMGGPRAINAINSTIPRFASGGTVARAAMGAGFKGGNLLRAVAESKGESGWNERAVGDGGKSKGLMQIHTGFNPWAAGLNLFNPSVNMRAAMRIFRSQGWGAWHANHVPHIGAARVAVASAGKGTSPAKRKRNKKLAKTLKRIRGIGLSKKTEAHLKKLTQNAAIYGEYADRASTLTPEGGAAGIVNGLGEAQWLQKELKTLFTLRNALIRAEKTVVGKREKVTKELERAYEFLRRHPLSGTTRGRDPVSGWSGVSPATGSMNAWNKQPIKKRKERMAKFLRLGGKLPSDRRFLADGRVATDRSGAGTKRQVANYKEKIIPALKKSRSGLGTRRGELLSSLETVQGLGAPGGVLKKLPAIGVLGGDIFRVQTALRDLAVKPTAVSDTTSAAPDVDTGRADFLAQLLRDANLRTAVSQSQYEVFRNMPAFGGQFAQGGVVPGSVGAPRMILAHGGETVTPPGQGNIVVKVIVEDGAVDKRRIRAEVEEATRGMARSGGRVLPGRGGGL